MATLTSLTFLAVILFVNCRHCSLRRITAHDGASWLNHSSTPEELEELEYDDQIEFRPASTDQARPNSNPSDGSKSIYFEHRDRRQAASDSTSTPAVDSSTQRANLKTDRKVEGITHEERIKILNLHNTMISELEITAANMNFMVHNKQVERAAFLWAKQCDVTAGFPTLDFGDFEFDDGEFGLNSGINESYNWDLEIEAWHSGREDFDILNLGCVPNSKYCTHYVRMVCAEVIYIGCSFAFCPIYRDQYQYKKNVYNYACYYVPSGNTEAYGFIKMQMPPYKRGKPATDCHPSRPYVWGNFCRTDPPCKDVRECQYPRDITTCLCDRSFYESGQPSVVLRWALLYLAVVLFTVVCSSINTYS